jgi:hypothetical protein
MLQGHLLAKERNRVIQLVETLYFIYKSWSSNPEYFTYSL